MVVLRIEKGIIDAFPNMKNVPPELKKFVVRKRLGHVVKGGEKCASNSPGRKKNLE